MYELAQSLLKEAKADSWDFALVSGFGLGGYVAEALGDYHQATEPSMAAVLCIALATCLIFLTKGINDYRNERQWQNGLFSQLTEVINDHGDEEFVEGCERLRRARPFMSKQEWHVELRAFTKAFVRLNG